MLPKRQRIVCQPQLPRYFEPEFIAILNDEAFRP